MPDSAKSDSPAVQTQLDRLAYLSPGRDILGLERITAILARLGNPHFRLPPVFHVAGTNGKGSTCAFLRAAIEASGYNVHVFTSPHLVRFNERIRLSGTLIADDYLATLLSRVLDVAENTGPSFFEVTTAAALLAFAEIPADAVILEVGLGGRLDATNIIPSPVSCGIASLGIDHEAFLLSAEEGTPHVPLDRIAYEKAGIAKSNVPLVTQKYAPSMQAAIGSQAQRHGAIVLTRGETWYAAEYESRLHYRDAHGKLSLPLPRLPGKHQADNAALAIAMLRHQNAICIPDAAYGAMMEWATWPARLQLLGRGPLTGRLPDADIWLDGGHNAGAGAALADAFADDRRLHVICGMLRNKDASAFLSPLIPRMASFSAVPVPDHEHHDPKDLCLWMHEAGIEPLYPAHNVKAVLDALFARKMEDGERPAILICGSLYLAGDVLKSEPGIPSIGFMVSAVSTDRAGHRRHLHQVRFLPCYPQFRVTDQPGLSGS